MTTTFTFDSLDELPTLERFEEMRKRYWVIKFKHEQRVYGFLLSPSEPHPVPNETMGWFRPTYGDYLEWLAGVGQDRDFAKYRRSK